jgi:YD repeat-containing protein
MSWYEHLEWTWKVQLQLVGKNSPPRVAESMRWHGEGNLINTTFPEMDFLIESRRLRSKRNLDCS